MIVNILLAISLAITAPLAFVAWLINAVVYILIRWIPLIGKPISTAVQTATLIVETPFILTAHKLGWTSPRERVADRLHNADKLQTYKAMIDSGEPELIKYAYEGLLEMAKAGNTQACKELLRIKNYGVEPPVEVEAK